MVRCSYSGRRGQCTHSRIDGSRFCRKHSNESDRMKGYRLSNPDLKSRFEHFSGDPQTLKTVAEEIVLLRTMVEDRLEMAQTETERLQAYNTVTPMIGQINKLVESLTKLERQSSTVIGKEALAKLGDSIVSILMEELDCVGDRDSIIDRVATRIASTVAESRNEE